MPNIKRVVVVDDDAIGTTRLQSLCTGSGSEVVGVAHQASMAQKIILEKRPDYVIMDIQLGEDRDGVDLANAILKQLPETKFIFVTASSEHMTIARIKTVRPEHIFIKPVPSDAINKALS